MIVFNISILEAMQTSAETRRNVYKGPVFNPTRIKTANALPDPDEGFPMAHRRKSDAGKSIFDALLPPEGISLDLETKRVAMHSRPADFR